jgi:hypothetical protein
MEAYFTSLERAEDPLQQMCKIYIFLRLLIRFKTENNQHCVNLPLTETRDEDKSRNLLKTVMIITNPGPNPSRILRGKTTLIP